MVGALLGGFFAVRAAMNRRIGIAAGEVFGVPLAEDEPPLVQILDLSKGFSNQQVLRMKRGVFDAELAHVGAGSVAAVQLVGETKVIENHIALLEERWRGRERPPLS
jgi:hypothetical protein